jgi:osmotically-inducible protein OsmY
MAGDSPSYDDIVRRTVLLPDTSREPSKDEEDVARHRAGAAADHIPHVRTPEELQTLEAVRRALTTEPSVDMDHVRIDIDGRELVLKGNVPGHATKERIEAIAKQVEGVERVDNQLAVRSA